MNYRRVCFEYWNSEEGQGYGNSEEGWHIVTAYVQQQNIYSEIQKRKLKPASIAQCCSTAKTQHNIALELIMMLLLVPSCGPCRTWTRAAARNSTKILTTRVTGWVKRHQNYLGETGDDLFTCTDYVLRLCIPCCQYRRMVLTRLRVRNTGVSKAFFRPWPLNAASRHTRKLDINGLGIGCRWSANCQYLR